MSGYDYSIGDRVAVKSNVYPKLSYQVSGQVVALTEDFAGVYLDTDVWPRFTILPKEDIELYTDMLQRIAEIIRSMGGDPAFDIRESPK